VNIPLRHLVQAAPKKPTEAEMSGWLQARTREVMGTSYEKYDKIYINGQWVSRSERIPSMLSNPCNEEAIATVTMEIPGPSTGP